MAYLARFLGLIAAFCACGAAAEPHRISVRTDLTIVQAAQPGRPSCGMIAPEDAQGALAETNALRRAHGLAPLRVNRALSLSAANHACEMAARGLMTHEGLNGSGPGQRARQAGLSPAMTAENIAAGPFNRERVVMEWARSAGHRGNILIPQMREFGIGSALASDGRTVFWAAVYAAPGGRRGR